MKNLHQNFKITQNVIIFNSKDEVLIIKHKNGKWLLSGGRIDEKENWKNALQRELKEEIGVSEIQINGIASVDTWYKEEQAYYGITFFGKIKEDEIKPNNEIIDYSWVPNKKSLEIYDFWHQKIKDNLTNILPI
jgi:8-oxo-dGTP pyrophosphatase MutT (NUDIX family)